MIPSPGVRHHEICIEVLWHVEKIVDEKKLGKVLCEIDVRMNDENVVRSDIIKR